jgi:hypothetical protein
VAVHRTGNLLLALAIRALAIRLLFSYALPMPVPTPICVPVVACKGCSALVPTASRALPPEAVAVLCPLCKEHRQYRPSEVFLGSPSFRLRAGVL